MIEINIWLTSNFGRLDFGWKIHINNPIIGMNLKRSRQTVLVLTCFVNFILLDTS
jgi:hypothetical protein